MKKNTIGMKFIGDKLVNRVCTAKCRTFRGGLGLETVELNDY